MKTTPRRGRISRSIATIAATAAAMVGAAGLAATAAPAASADTAAPVTVLDSAGAAMLQGVGQEQLLCPGGALQGKVTVAIIEPFLAQASPAAGGCNLADIKAANPQTKILAYVNVAAMSPREPASGVFQSSCVSLPDDGSRPSFTVPVGGNAALLAAMNETPQTTSGLVHYPDFDWLLLADTANPDYRTACASGVKTMLTTKSTPGVRTATAPATNFDGVMFDDVNMSPQHGIDIATVGAYGSWTTDAEYGDDMNNTVEQAARAARGVGRAVTLTANVGVTTWAAESDLGRGVNPESHTTSSTGVQRALTLARLRLDAGTTLETSASPLIDAFIREFSVQWSMGYPLSNPELDSFRGFAQGVAARNVTVINHDYSVDLLNTSVGTYSGGGAVSGQPCLLTADANRAAIVAAAKTRRTNDQAFTYALTLAARTSALRNVAATVNQAQPSCQDAGGAGQATRAESVTTPSVNLADTKVAALAAKLRNGVYATSGIDPVQGTEVRTFSLSDGSRLYFNPTTTTVTATVGGVTRSFGPRSVSIG
ncbi:hypothetical protein [Arthrobacter sp. NPDC090010]|uniref:hypothetical protein n=1 Tax=Arthrobacter sp. NPDC090010 TaxID=3363942 RepID=UPI0038236E16